MGASLWLRVPRIVDIDLTMIFGCKDVERELSRLQILPTDIDRATGSNLLTVITNYPELTSHDAN